MEFTGEEGSQKVDILRSFLTQCVDIEMVMCYTLVSEVFSIRKKKKEKSLEAKYIEIVKNIAIIN